MTTATTPVETTTVPTVELPKHNGFLGTVLRAVNTVRGKFGKDPIYELPVGYRQDAEQCVLARAFRDLGPYVWVSPSALEVDNDAVSYVMFEDDLVVLGEFVDRFDNGDFPELIRND